MILRENEYPVNVYEGYEYTYHQQQFAVPHERNGVLVPGSKAWLQEGC